MPSAGSWLVVCKMEYKSPREGMQDSGCGKIWVVLSAPAGFSPQKRVLASRGWKDSHRQWEGVTMGLASRLHDLLLDYSPQTYYWYSVRQQVFHISEDCTTGKNIEPENLRSGDGGRQLCQECRRIILDRLACTT